MKHLQQFNTFLNDVVNLNPDRIKKLESSSTAVIEVIKTNPVFSSAFKFSSPQGSHGHRTIIKPVSGKEFDADIVVFMKPIIGWEPKNYIKKLFDIFENNGNYKGKVTFNTRCVSINYSGDFHIDLVPCIVKYNFWGEEYSICNRITNDYEYTNPEAYKKWVYDKNKITKNNNLIKAIRLIKYQRDIKKTFSCKSILLTTLLCNQVYESDITLNTFKDLPTTLKILINRLDKYLQQNIKMPRIENPVHSTETFTRHWDQNKYTNFINMINKYNGWINDAFNEQSKLESINKWRKVFGDSFAKKAKSIRINKPVISSALVENEFTIPKHYVPLPWNTSGLVSTIDITINYKDKSSKIYTNGYWDYIDKNKDIRFEITSDIPANSEIYWQVANTGYEAQNKGDLRGDFILGEDIHIEHSLYKGTHIIEALVVNNNHLIARSGIIPITII